MSLQLAAKHIAHKGRGPDTTLVHMSRDEVKSLNDLAMAHGGQLTINPETGLPEAGFLSAILPMVAGAALTGMSGGVINPMTAGFLVGGGSFLMNPKAGLMGALSAGMGAYGGAGLASGLSGIATSEAGTTTQNAMTAAADEAEKKLIADRALAAQQQAAQQTLQSANAITPNVAPSEFLQDYGPVGQYTAGSAPLPTSPGGMNITAPAAQLPSTAPNALDIQTVRDAAMESAYRTPPSGIDAMYKGAESLVSNPTADKFKTLGGGSYMGLAQKGLAAAAPAITQPAKLNMPTAATSQKSIAPRYKFSPGMVNPTPAASATGMENTYFRPQYTAISDEEAKNIYGFAGGGPVEQMSNDNAIGANTGFPQAYLHNAAYSTPYQTPISQNVLMGAGDVAVDPYTGEQKMAAGGVSYDPQTQRYTGGIADAYRPENIDVNAYNDTGGPATSGGPTAASSGPGSIGSPTGTTAGDFGYAMSNQNFSPIAAMVAQAIMDATSPTSSISANAVNGMDAQSDAATAAAAAAAAADASGGAPGMGGGAGPSSASDGGGDGGAPGMGGDARGGYLSHGRFDQRPRMATGGLSDARYNLGGYSDGGRLLRGPGDGVSDSIPAVIGKKQPARLADGEFVVPARIVSELGNGSTEAGARRLYAMMDRIQSARGKTVGKGKVAKNTRADKYLPA